MSYTTGATTFNMDFTEIAEESWERAGREMRTGYDLRTARRSMNIMTIEWANRGLNMWTIEQGVIDLTPGLNTYSLPLDTIDLLDHVIRTGANSASTQADLTISRISVSTYATIPNKLTQARPIQVWIQRLSGETNPTTLATNGNVTIDATTITLTSTAGLAGSGFIKLDSEIMYYNYLDGNTIGNVFRGQAGTTAATHTTATAVYVPQLPAVTVWPTPDNSTSYQLVYYRMRRIQDAGTGTSVQDIPFRFIPCMVAGLALQLSMKLPDVDPQRIMALKTDYEQQWDMAQAEDRETAPLRFVPRNMFYA
jgi:hypothetical protein